MHEQIDFDTITTEEYKNIKNFEIYYGFMESKFGHCIIGVNDERVCYLSFFEEGKENSAIDNLKNEWPNAILRENNAKTENLGKEIFEKSDSDSKLKLLLRGTDMQINVWKQLVNLKAGSTCSYEAIAKAIGKPKAVRAVANAIAKNRLAYVIPCHRVIQKTGNVSKYRWGAQRKKKILKYETDL